MKIKNMVARLITVDHEVSGEVKSFRFMPAGEPIEVPKQVASSLYIKALINDGSLSIVDVEDDVEDDADPAEASRLSDLVAQAEELGVKVDKRWGDDRLTSEIEAALER